MAVMDGYELFKLLFLTVSVLICLCHGSDVQVPESVKAVERSCVTLPCSTSPHSHVVWYLKMTGRDPIVYSNNTGDITDNFKTRTSVTGDPAQGDCSLRIDRVRPDENELKLYPWIYPDTGNKYQYIKINVVKPGNPEISMESPQVEGTLFSANCTVHHSCPSSPPRIEWFGPNPVTNNVITTVNQDGFWTSVAQAKFKPNLEDLGRRLKCESVFNREHKPSKILPLNILYSPKNVHIMTERRVVEGATASLTCMSNSNPPPSSYQWIITQKSSTIKHDSKNVSLQDVRRDTSVSCTAQNSIGQGQSDPLLLNVHFPPTILLDSGCSDWAGGMRCVCRAEAEPRPSISWMINGSIALFPYFKTSANYTERVTVSELTGPLNHNVSCEASNYLGKNSYQIPTHQPLSGGIIVVVVAAVVIVIIVIAVIFIYWRKRSHKKTSGNSTKQLKTDDLDLNACSYVNETVEVDLYVNTAQTKKDDGSNAHETM